MLVVTLPVKRQIILLCIWLIYVCLQVQNFAQSVICIFKLKEKRSFSLAIFNSLPQVQDPQN